MSWIRKNVSKGDSQTKYAYNLSQHIKKNNPLNTTATTSLNTMATTSLNTTATTSLNTTTTNSLKPTVISTLNTDTITKIKHKIKDDRCLDYIDAILYINLEHRKDRDEHCLNEIKKIDPTLSKTHRIDAVSNKSNGALGCSLSHIKALELFIKNPSWNNILVLEDDFTFVSDNIENINKSILYLLKNMSQFDILLLGVGIDDLQTNTTEDELILKVNSSQTTSGYIVTRKYVYTLLANYIKSSNKMKKYGKHTNWCLDQFWKRLMPIGNWYTLKDRIAYQYGNYSDIENAYNDYKC